VVNPSSSRNTNTAGLGRFEIALGQAAPIVQLARDLCAVLELQRLVHGHYERLHAAQAHECGVVGDAVQPRAEPRAALERADGLECAEKRFLHHVLGFGLVAHHTQRQAVYARRMEFHALTAGGFIARTDAVKQG
jgi:hypothetical protein